MTMKTYNCIVVFNYDKTKALFCRRIKDPFKGKLNFVGGKVEAGESEEDAAYRELMEETGITREDIRLHRLMDIRYYHQGFDLEMYVGILREDKPLREELNPLLWLPLTGAEHRPHHEHREGRSPSLTGNGSAGPADCGNR